MVPVARPTKSLARALSANEQGTGCAFRYLVLWMEAGPVKVVRAVQKCQPQRGSGFVRPMAVPAQRGRKEE